MASRRGRGATHADRLRWVREKLCTGKSFRAVCAMEGAPSSATLQKWCKEPPLRAEALGELERPPPPVPSLPAAETAQRTGRPSKLLDDDIRAEVVRGLRIGLGYDRAAQLAGINPATLKRWVRLAQQAADGDESEAGRQLLQAEAQGVVDLLERVVAGDNGWQGAAWVLERCRGFRAKVEAEITVSSPVEALGDDELALIALGTVADA